MIIIINRIAQFNHNPNDNYNHNYNLMFIKNNFFCLNLLFHVNPKYKVIKNDKFGWIFMIKMIAIKRHLIIQLKINSDDKNINYMNFNIKYIELVADYTKLHK